MCLFLVIMQPTFVTHILLLLPWWSSDVCFTIVPCLQDPPSLHCIATVDTVGTNGKFSWVSIFTIPWDYLLIRTAWLLSSLSNNISTYWSWQLAPNRSVQQQCMCVYIYIYNSTGFKAFFMVRFRNLMHTSICPILWWLYNDDTPW